MGGEIRTALPWDFLYNFTPTLSPVVKSKVLRPAYAEGSPLQASQIEQSFFRRRMGVIFLDLETGLWVVYIFCERAAVHSLGGMMNDGGNGGRKEMASFKKKEKRGERLHCLKENNMPHHEGNTQVKHNEDFLPKKMR